MTTMAHANGRPQRTTHSSRPAAFAGNIAARAHLGAIKRFFGGVLAVLLAGSAVAGIMALKTADYLSHFAR